MICVCVCVCVKHIRISFNSFYLQEKTGGETTNIRYKPNETKDLEGPYINQCGQKLQEFKHDNLTKGKNFR